MKTNQILLILGGAAVAYGLYTLVSRPTPPPGFGGAQYIPPGGQWNGFLNGTNQPTWVNVVGGVATVVNSLGQVLQTLPWDQFGGGTSGGNNNPDSGNGQWVDNGQGSLVWQAN